MDTTQKTNSKALDYSALSGPATSNQLSDYKKLRASHSLTYTTWRTVAAVVVVPFLIYALMMSFRINSAALSLIVLVAVSAAIFGAAYLRREQQRHARIYAFAQQNGLVYREMIWNPADLGLIFGEGDERRILMSLGMPGSTEIGNYQYMTGSGKNRAAHNWIYVRVQLTRHLPHMVLDAKKNNIFGMMSNLPEVFDRDQTLSLEGDFDKHFTLYVPAKYQTDALYVFTPDVMSALIEHGAEYDIEIIENQLYMYKLGSVELSSADALQQLLAIIDAIAPEIRDQSQHYVDIRGATADGSTVGVTGARLKRGINWYVVVMVVFVVVYFALQAVTAFRVGLSG